MSTQLPEIDSDSALSLWRAYLEAQGFKESDVAKPVIECFGDSAELAEELLDAVRYGDKRATSSMANEYVYWGEQPPKAGNYWVICDGEGKAQIIVHTDSVELSSFYEVDAEFAAAEGEGDRSLENWRSEHAKFWTRTHQAMGMTWTPELTEMPGHEVIQERFSIVWPAELAD